MTTTITTIGLDLAKKVFQAHGVDGEGRVVIARKLRRKEVLAFFAKLASCLVGMAAIAIANKTTRIARGDSWRRPIGAMRVNCNAT